MAGILRKTYAEIDLGAVRNNYRKIKEHTAASVMPVVKANAYGHGAVQIAKILESENAEMFGVATIEEGIELRESGIKTPILILGSIYPLENYKKVLEYNLTPIVASSVSLNALNEESKGQESPVAFHLKIDTGMGRIGISSETVSSIFDEIKKCTNLVCEGVFSHLPRADEDAEYTETQIKRFQEVVSKIDTDIKYFHIANTAGIINFPSSHYNLVRPGLSIYGLYPDNVSIEDFKMLPVLKWYSSIVFIKKIKKGTPVSYGGTWTAERDSVIGTVCVGYADGYQRILSGKAEVLINGKRCRVVGRVCMDMVMVDITDVPGADIGNEVILIGSSDNESITAEEMASWAETINYEIITSISSRVPRVYKDEAN